MFKKHLTSIICVVLAVLMCTTSFAATFSDVTDDFSWAQKAITEMSSQGIIAGYPDGSFKPAAGITKIQAMLLISRILGYNQGVYAPYMDTIVENAGISGLGIEYEKEVAFLVYKGIFTKEEIAAEASTLNNPLFRYEVAQYLTRAMGAYNETAAKASASTGYADDASIPENYKAFVSYVKDSSLMLGTSTTEFSPLIQVTRAQMAVLLKRVMDRLSLQIFEAEYIGLDKLENNLKVEVLDTEGSYNAESTSYYLNGEEYDPESFLSGDKVILVFESGVLKRVEIIKTEEELNPPIDETYVEVQTINAKVTEVNLSDNYLNVLDTAVNGSKRFYFTEECKAIVDGNIRTLTAIRKNDHVSLSLNKFDEIINVTILDKESTFAGGKIESISTEKGLFITVSDSRSDIYTYTTTDNVAVKRNGEMVTLADILEGDTIVKCTLYYNQIASLETKSIVSSTSGSITEIVISNNSSIVIDGKGGATRYNVGDGIKITLDGASADIYSLRLGMAAEVTLDSNTITKITVTSVSDAGQFSGQIKVINTAYGFINVALFDGTEKQVFVKSTTKIYDDSTGRSRALSTLKEGDTLVILGKSVNGAFQATTIILVAE